MRQQYKNKKSGKDYKNDRLNKKAIKQESYTEEIENDKEVIAGRNSILEAINSGREINKILFQEGIEKGRLKTIFNIANEKKIVCQEVPKRKLDNLTSERHQGVIAFVAPYSYYELDEVLNGLEINEKTTILLLDHIEDPHNLGAIIRSAEASGVKAVIIPKRRSAVVSQTVVKSSAGAIEYMPVIRVGNLVDTIKKLKEKGFWVAGTTLADNSEDYSKIAKDVPLVIVIGNEGEGMSSTVTNSCDFLYHLPMLGKTQSLNASVAAGIVMYERIKK
ncbi:23S rRNA (guanosine(2251)-2'-O)-methyltransferase RlmB [Gemelliphila palaticanis]|uniref:23S rRNA (Guanosine(2251)-2'-O)-methyltransferase RlmB n=1 Tax=Gemelliphila palaticanis TaxID=81950 RepID=A0ABX2SYV1_9BACL|nr:23S rRNA (guanosine(2251)-2'-O)-methyltransferase RlmB [Gemella palaticanis]MBF0715096.1 23S rRNA (guanosine(2251)-2'-O)-methyltransferase RlmB [Gemella palaticanis]NYS47026.1 23S rRNA (guanosine(2251)-2'-O)-methyltransferase RlmB [Gemella palaticanis]